MKKALETQGLEQVRATLREAVREFSMTPTGLQSLLKSLGKTRKSKKRDAPQEALPPSLIAPRWLKLSLSVQALVLAIAAAAG
jgi:hypothetical protein